MTSTMTTRIRLLVGIIISLLLTIIPVPELLVDIRPPWILLFLLYLQFYLPEYFNLFLVFILGLLLDALLATVIGEHALALTLVAWLASNKTRRFYFFSIAQQILLVGFLVFVYQGVLYLIDAFLGFHTHILSIVGSTIVSILLWPWICLLGKSQLNTK